MRQDRVTDEAPSARHPALACGVVRQPLDVRPRGAAIERAEQACRLDPRVEDAVGRRQVPDRAQAWSRVAIRQPGTRVQPRRAQIVAPPDRCPEPGASATGVEDPFAGSWQKWLIGQPSQNGPRRRHASGASRSAASVSRTNAPFRVPSRTSTRRSIAVPASCGRPAARRGTSAVTRTSQIRPSPQAQRRTRPRRAPGSQDCAPRSAPLRRHRG